MVSRFSLISCCHVGPPHPPQYSHPTQPRNPYLPGALTSVSLQQALRPLRYIRADHWMSENMTYMGICVRYPHGHTTNIWYQILPTPVRNHTVIVVIIIIGHSLRIACLQPINILLFKSIQIHMLLLPLSFVLEFVCLPRSEVRSARVT